MKRLHICSKCGASFTNDRARQRYCDNCIYAIVNEQDREIRELKNDLKRYAKALEDVKKIAKDFDRQV